MKSIIISDNFIKNGQFGSDEFWIKTPGVVFSGNKATIVPNSSISQWLEVQQNSIYRIVFTVSESTGGSIRDQMTLVSNPRVGNDGQLVAGEILAEMQLTGDKTYQFEGVLAEHMGIAYHLGLAIGSSFNDKASFKVENVQFYLIDEKSTAPHPGQLLLNGDFSEGLDKWVHSTNVTEYEGKAFFSGRSSIEQSITHSSSKSYTLKFDISNTLVGGTAYVYNGMKALSFDSDGAYSLEFHRDASTDTISVSFETNDSFELDNVVLFATPE